MADGGWRKAEGGWRMADGGWRMAEISLRLKRPKLSRQILLPSGICCANDVPMQMIASRELSSKPGAVLARVAAEGAMVVTRDGRPMAILSPTSAESLIEDLQEIAFSKARRAVRNLRAAAQGAGMDSLSLEEINHEIQAVRKIAK
jgi:antitoxin (DNA-binding transcriptional repressor) of toxin-antitoxin stability system